MTFLSCAKIQMDKQLFDNLLYLPLDMENPPLDHIDYLNGLDFSKIYQDDYRNCYHVPIMYNQAKKEEFQWMPWSFQMPKLRQWCEDVLFPITGRSRIMIITTPNGTKNPPHIDCSREMFDTPQHKFRYVLQGNVDDLDFLGKDKNVRPTAIDKPFVMSGKWPHEMHNTSGDTKFTLALGAPWDGTYNDKKYVDLLDRSYQKYKDYYLGVDFELPNNWEDLFEEKYTFREKANEMFLKQG